jgi:hypothetical protein
MVYLNGILKLEETESQISKKILEALLPQVDSYLNKIFNKVSVQIKDTVIQSIKSAPEYSALLYGQLKAEFGLPDSESRVNSIINFWENITVEYKNTKISRGGLSGGFKISMIKRDFTDVLSTNDAVFITEKGDALNWLEWLLLFGNKTIIKDYNVQLGPNPRSRTGMAIMQGAVSGKWSVPNSYSGTINNNWITRAIDSADASINNILLKALKG